MNKYTLNIFEHKAQKHGLSKKDSLELIDALKAERARAERLKMMVDGMIDGHSFGMEETGISKVSINDLLDIQEEIDKGVSHD